MMLEKFIDGFSDELEKIATQLKALPGGKAHNHQVEEFDPQQLDLGVKVEREHTKDFKKRLEIAADHLVDDKKYYTKLDRAGLADELEKKADAQNVLLGGAALSDLAHGPWGEGGQGFMEARGKKSLEEAQRALKATKPGTPAHAVAQDDLLSAARRYEGRVQGSENFGIAPAMAATLYGSRKLTGLLGRKLVQGEQGLSTTPEQVEALRKVISPTANTQLFEGGLGAAMHIPKGGLFPKILRPHEVGIYQKAGIPEELIERGLREGLNLVPANAGRHITAHELGHHAFSTTGLGKVVRKARLPLGIGGPLASYWMAGSGDPDSKKAKWAPAVAALATAPILGEEAAASLKGYKALKTLGASPAELAHARKSLTKAWGTYGAKIGLPMIAAPLAIRYARKINRARREKMGLPTSEEARQLVDQAKGKK